MTRHIHMICASKGGVGKSFVARLLAEHFQSRSITPICIDLDASNRTFASYDVFNAEEFLLLDPVTHDIDPRAFDIMVEHFITPMTEQDGPNQPIIVDVGTNVFIPLLSYLRTEAVMAMLQNDYGLNIQMHAVIAGGPDFLETLAGFNDLCTNFQRIDFCVWKNSHHGQMSFNGVPLEDNDIYKKHKKRVRAEILIPAWPARTVGKDVNKMLTKFHTFAEVRTSGEYAVMEQHRLGRVWADLNKSIKAANL